MYGLFLLSSLVALSLANKQETIVIVEPRPPHHACGPNEVVSDCVTPCQPSCEFPNQLPCPEFSARSGGHKPEVIIVKPLPLPPPPPPAPCSPGCVCAHGFVRNEWGLCIHKSHCPTSCKPNSHFESCGPRCQPTCDIVEPKSLSSCNGDCVSGCFCNSGYVKDLRTGQCVRPKDCSQICPENEHYSDCGTECVATCDKPVIDWTRCTNHTSLLPGCYCNQGFLRDPVTKKCVRKHDCTPPKSCPIYEEWYKCKPCTPTCHNPNPICAAICQPGCDCKKGYVRDTKNNKCVPLCECSHHKH